MITKTRTHPDSMQTVTLDRIINFQKAFVKMVKNTNSILKYAF